jgi:hypothetical protein
MRTEYTPGPWKWVYNRNEQLNFPPVYGMVELVGPDVENDFVVTFPSDGYHEGYMESANAHLIVAAPELLEACKWADRALAPFSKDPAEKSGIAMIRNAIAKAKGET